MSGGGKLSAMLQPLFRPENVAIIGASRTPGKQGYAVLRNLMRCGFSGRILPVNPAGGDIEGLRCYASIAEIAEPIDCAMIVVPAPVAVEAVRQCAEAGVKAAIVAASGFAELGTREGEERQAAIAAIARSSGLRIIGPNTNGIYNATDRMSIGYNAMHAETIEPGDVSIISHSGALFGGVLRDLNRLGASIAKFVPVGNEVDLGMLDFLEALIEDEATRVIGLITEAISDGGRFRTLAGRASAAGKPIVALKVGRSAAGGAAALAHSSRLAGSARAYDAFFAACGIAGVRSVEALAGGCAVLSSRKAGAAQADRRLVCVATSGAGGALVVDFASEHGIALAGGPTGEWDRPLGSAIAAIPTAARIRNPIDLGSIGGNWERLSDVFDALGEAGLAGPTVVYAHIAPEPKQDQNLLGALARRRSETDAPIVAVAPGGLAEAIEARYREQGIPLFHDTATCVDSLACHYATLPHAAGEASPTAKQGGDRRESAIRKCLRGASSSRVLSEIVSADVLRQAGLPVVESRRVQSVAAARRAAEALGFPVVLKALAPEVAHKSMLGLVVTNIPGVRALDKQYRHLEHLVASLGQRKGDVPFVLQPMIQARAELILGASREQGLGYFLMAGLGGVFAEALDEVILFPVPADAGFIRSRLAETRTGMLVEAAGERVMVQLVEGLLAVQRVVLAAGSAVESVDVNPFAIGPDGLIALDALVVLGEAGRRKVSDHRTEMAAKSKAKSRMR